MRGRLAALATETLVGIAVEDILLREARITELDDRLRIVRIKARALEARSRGAAFGWYRLRRWRLPGPRALRP